MSALLYLAAVALITALFVALGQGTRGNRLSSVFLPQRANVMAARRRMAAVRDHRHGGPASVQV